jgi:hypothetical protein
MAHLVASGADPSGPSNSSDHTTWYIGDGGVVLLFCEACPPHEIAVNPVRQAMATADNRI